MQQTVNGSQSYQTTRVAGPANPSPRGKRSLHLCVLSGFTPSLLRGVQQCRKLQIATNQSTQHNNSAVLVAIRNYPMKSVRHEKWAYWKEPAQVTASD